MGLTTELSIYELRWVVKRVLYPLVVAAFPEPSGCTTPFASFGPVPYSAVLTRGQAPSFHELG